MAWLTSKARKTAAGLVSANRAVVSQLVGWPTVTLTLVGLKRAAGWPLVSGVSVYTPGLRLVKTARPAASVRLCAAAGPVSCTAIPGTALPPARTSATTKRGVATNGGRLVVVWRSTVWWGGLKL